LLLAAGVEPGRRAQTLTLQEWAALYRVYRGTAAGVSR
jgi:hypothetical protein